LKNDRKIFKKGRMRAPILPSLLHIKLQRNVPWLSWGAFDVLWTKGAKKTEDGHSKIKTVWAHKIMFACVRLSMILHCRGIRDHETKMIKRLQTFEMGGHIHPDRSKARRRNSSLDACYGWSYRTTGLYDIEKDAVVTCIQQQQKMATYKYLRQGYVTSDEMMCAA
jgi:hypothetical protein